MSPLIFFIEGNIGTGKTTFCKQIEKFGLSDVQIIYEPVDEWENIKDTDGKNILEHFYDNMKKNCYLFQSNAFITRYNALKKIDNSKKFVFVERSMYSDRNVFAKTCHENGLMADIEWEVYNNWFNTLIKDLGITHNFIYLKCTPELSLQRIKKRDRHGEENINLDYLTNLHHKHEEWLVDNSVIIDASRNYLNEDIFKDIFNEMTALTPVII